MAAATLLVAFALAAPAGARTLASGELAIAGDVDGSVVTWAGLSPSGKTTVRTLNLATGAQAVLFSVSGSDTFVTDVKTGGGRVAFNIINFTRTRANSTVRVMAADGSGGGDIATSSIDIRNRCGNGALMLDVASDGEVFVAHTSIDRAGVLCGDATTGFTMAVNGYAANGTVRTVYSTAGTSLGRALDLAAVSLAQANGNHLVLGTRRSAIEIDLLSGAAATYPATLRGSEVRNVSVDGSGRVAMSELVAKTRRKTVRRRGKKRRVRVYYGQSSMTLFDRPLDPASGHRIYSSRKGVVKGSLCGSRILRSVGPFGPPDFDLYLWLTSEVGANGELIRELIPDVGFAQWDMFGCDASNALFSGGNARSGKPRLDMVPLG